MESTLGGAFVSQVEEALSKIPYTLVSDLAGGRLANGAFILIRRQVMKRWPPDKVTALILVCGCLVLIATGINTEVKSILTMSAVYLFATSITERRAAKNKPKEECE